MVIVELIFIFFKPSLFLFSLSRHKGLEFIIIIKDLLKQKLNYTDTD